MINCALCHIQIETTQKHYLCLNCLKYKKIYKDKLIELTNNTKDFSQFKTHPDLPQHLLFCKEGYCFNNKIKRFVGSMNDDGYIRLQLKIKDVVYNYRLHRIIYECFNNKINNDMVINHINEIKYDNNINNLEMISQKENIQLSTNFKKYIDNKNKNKNEKIILQLQKYKLKQLKLINKMKEINNQIENLDYKIMKYENLLD